MTSPTQRAWIACVIVTSAASFARAAEPKAATSATPPASPVASPAAQPADPTAGLTIDRLEWSGLPAGAEVVVIENDYGDVRIRGAKGDDVVEAHTVVQRLDSAGEKLVLAVERIGATLVIRVEYPPATPPDPMARARRERHDRADIAVFVTDGVRVEARTRGGIVHVKGFKGDGIDAQTDTGAIRIVAEKSVRARSTSGPIHVLVREPEGQRSMWLESESGSIEAELPPEADLDVRVRTGGKVELGYPAKVESKDGRSRASFELGKGDRVLVVESRSGDVRIAPAPVWKPEPGQQREREPDE